MEIVLEIIVTLLAVTIYGTEERPRSPIWRNTVRVIAFGGAFLSGLGLLGLIPVIDYPIAAMMLWGVCGLIVLVGEYEAGSKRVAIAAIVAAVILILLTSITWLAE
ncbi:hypothetical protein KBY25_13255 [Ruegeria pomeroyi]|nr:hypothetical protein [Ruegeria pomeroyi]